MTRVYSPKYSYDYYLRSAYSKNHLARKTDTRSGQSTKDLITADSAALKKMTKKLRNLEYDADHGSEIFNNVKIYAEAYNNLMDSTSETDDTAISSLKKQMKKMTAEERKDLEKIGITITSSGKLKIKDNTLAESSPSDIARVFSSKNTFTESVQTYANRIRRKSFNLVTYTPNATKKNTSSISSSGNTIDLNL